MLLSKGVYGPDYCKLSEDYLYYIVWDQYKFHRAWLSNFQYLIYFSGEKCVLHHTFIGTPFQARGLKLRFHGGLWIALINKHVRLFCDSPIKINKI